MRRDSLFSTFATVLLIMGCAPASHALDASGGATENRVDIYGHRGARALAPENTMPGYRAMMAIGVDFIDMDINLTKDGELVVTHDFSLNPAITRPMGSEDYIKSSTMWIRQMSYAETQKYDVGKADLASQYGRTYPDQYAWDGTTMPKLIDVIRWAKKVGGPGMKFQIEMKTDPSLDPGQYGDPKLMAEKLVKIIEAEGIVDRVEVQAFDFRCMLAVKALNPKIALQFLSWNPSKYQWRDPDPEVAGLWTAGELLVNHGNSIPQLIKDMGGTVWGVQDTGLEKAMLDRAKELGLRVIVWSLPSYPDTEINVRLTETLIAWGVDGFITDRPDIIRGLLAARGHYHFPPSCSEARPCK